MHAAFDVKRCPHQNDPSILSQWLDFEAGFPNPPSEFFVPDNPGVPDNILEAQLTKALHEFITTSIHVRQARFAYGQCLAKLARRKAAKKRRINKPLSPVFRLPNELISYIFQIIDQPILVSHICHRWRAIAIDTPSLWSYFHDNMGRNQTQMFLKRARNHPLTLSYPEFYEDIPLRSVTELCVRISKPASIEHFRNEPAPLLEFLHIDCESEGRTPYNLEYLFNVSLFANHAPKLKKVKLDTLVLPSFPTQSVTELIFQYCFFPETATTIRFLQLIPTLRSLVLWENKFQDQPSEPLDCQLPSVKKLSVCYCWDTNISIIAPNLEDLYLSSEIADYPVVYPGSSVRRLWLNAEHFVKQSRSHLIHTFQYIREGVRALQISANQPTFLDLTLSSLFEDSDLKFPSLSQLIIDCHVCDSSELAYLQDIVRVPNVAVFCPESRWAYEDVAVFMPDFDELRFAPSINFENDVLPFLC